MDARYRFGIEEEYFLADASTRGTPRRTESFHGAVRARVPTVERELLTAKVDVATSPTDSPATAHTQQTNLRAGLAETPGNTGCWFWPRARSRSRAGTGSARPRSRATTN